jgi:multidrug efflux pump subunit AcrA (membrane-fusion protein)
VGFTELHADAAGTVTAVGAEPGEVVQAGQMVLQVARQDGRDAIFDVPAQLLRQAPDTAIIEVALTMILRSKPQDGCERWRPRPIPPRGPSRCVSA